MKVALDGPAGAGKSTIAKAVANKLAFVYIDTGAMYRAVGLYALRKNIDTKNEVQAIIDFLPQFDLEIKYVDGTQKVFLMGEDVSEEIREPEVSVAASNVATIPEVRIKLVELQRKLSEKADVIMDGRDIGTYVLPDAEIKIFLTANVEARAERRYKELMDKGVSCSFEEVLSDMRYRDANDSSRAFAPLKQAEDAILVDTTDNTLEESIERIMGIIRGARNVL